MAASSTSGASDPTSPTFSLDVDSLPRTGRPTDPVDPSARTQKPKPHPLLSQNQKKHGELGSSPLQNQAARRSSSPYGATTSPSRGLGRASPRHLSPATSQIFERDVQESTASLAPELSPAIPNHIATEDHIPPVLEASSLAITDNLDPDEVEIVMHTAHQPAAVAVAHSGLGDTQPSAHISHSDLTSIGAISANSPLPGGLSSDAFGPSMHAAHGHSPPQLHASDSTSQDGESYGAVDPGDPRRLSFISFADVVNAEHAEQHGAAAHDMLSLSSATGSVAGNRSPSPVRSPVLPASPAVRGGGEASPMRGAAAGSQVSGHVGGPGAHSEITIETMRQTLQKTGSNDVPGSGSGSGGMSQPMSATSNEDVTMPFGHR